jgi:hypothetical protein
MKNLEFFEILGKNINFVLSGDERIDGQYEIRLIKPKYSAGNIKSNKLFVDGEPLKTKGSRVNYKCPVCLNDYNILTKRFLSKNTLICRSCKELSEEKRKKQSEFMRRGLSDKNSDHAKKKILKISSLDFIKNSNNFFDLETTEFKEDYYSNHVNQERFNLIKPHIYSVNGVKFRDDLKYYEHLRNNNQMRYSSYLYDEKNDRFIHFDKISYVCESCDSVFKTTRIPAERTNKYKIHCKKCSFCNNTFKIRNTLNCLGEKVTYQSKPELKMIEYLNSRKIPVYNGPVIEYYFNGKPYNYLVDFFIPSFNFIVEIKDPHIWHLKQVKSGRWQEKEKSAINYAYLNNLEYKLIFSQYLNEFLNLF